MTRYLTTTIMATLFSATISFGAQCGDVNDDGAVDIGDALLIAQYDSGMRACGFAPFSQPRVCDVTLDGQCDMQDAEAISLCDSGVLSCEFDCHPFNCLRGQRKLSKASR